MKQKQKYRYSLCNESSRTYPQIYACDLERVTPALFERTASIRFNTVGNNILQISSDGAGKLNFQIVRLHVMDINIRKIAGRAGSVVAFLGITAMPPSVAQENDPDPGGEIPDGRYEQRMTSERLAELIVRVDDEAVLEGATWFFHIEGLEAAVVYDVTADRMRIIMPIGPADELDEENLLRMMQANFDSALDARYAVAQGTLWGVFIHPLSSLTSEDFLVGLGQTANVVMSYGSTYSSGLFIYGNGDSAEIERQRLIERLRKADT